VRVCMADCVDVNETLCFAGAATWIKNVVKGTAMVLVPEGPRLERQVTPRLAVAERICGAHSVHAMRTRLSARRAEFDVCLGGGDPGELLTPGLD
jgi:hypothetical protein